MPKTFQEKYDYIDTYIADHYDLDNNKVPYNTTSAYKKFSTYCKEFIQMDETPVNFEDYDSKTDAYKAFNKLFPAYKSMTKNNSKPLTAADRKQVAKMFA